MPVSSRPRPAEPAVGPSERPAVAALLLAPGAGSSADHPGLVAVDEAVSALGVTVRRVDFPYRRAGRRAPDRPPVLLAAITDAAAELAADAGCPPGAVVLGGRSMGGRIASMAVAGGLPAAGLVLVSYPLHPPGRPERQRDAHFADIAVPCLFVSGTRDAFGSPDELTAATRTIGGPVEHVWVADADHGLRRRDEEVADAVARWIARCGADHPGPEQPAPGRQG